jgi:hypothetical protein
MSRLLFGVLVMTSMSYETAIAFAATDDPAPEYIARQKRLVTIDRDGCIVNPDDADNTIVVCAEGEDERLQKRSKSRLADPDRIWRGEAVSTKRAGARDNRSCGVIGAGLGCVKLPENWIKGNYSPPYPPDFKDVIAGLPEAEMVVTSGSNGSVDPTPP